MSKQNIEDVPFENLSFVSNDYFKPTDFEICCYTGKLLNKLNLLNNMVNYPVDIGEIKKAIYIARKYHGNQKRQSGEPYYSHPLEVAYMLAEYTGAGITKYYKTDLFITAILHDTLEDTELTYEMISKIFSPLIANSVQDLTRVKVRGAKISSAKMIESLWLGKKFELIFIKQLDRLHNLQTIKAKSADKIIKIINETFDSFIIFAIGEQDKYLEQALYKLCCQTLSTEMIEDKFSYFTSRNSHLSDLSDTDTDRYLAQVFQNTINPT